jgi:hypothetical protein
MRFLCGRPAMANLTVCREILFSPASDIIRCSLNDMRENRLTTSCPSCEATLEYGAVTCHNCGQEFCADCFYPLAEEDTVCQRCGAAYALYCPRCDAEVDLSESQCPICDLKFEETEEVIEGRAPGSIIVPDQPREADDEAVACPVCSTIVYLGDGFCRECGTSLCANCGNTVGADDQRCRNCGRELFYDCPICNFELTADSEVCPNCDALFPCYCPYCQAVANLGDSDCTVCGRQLTVIQRKSARIVRSFEVGEIVVRLVACPSCGKVMDPAEEGPVTPCPKCATRLCAICHVVLETGEVGCPRCGPVIQGAKDSELQCPECGGLISGNSDECPHCQQMLCPNCQAAIVLDQVSCTHCGVEFELVCPACDEDVSAEAEMCPSCGALF